MTLQDITRVVFYPFTHNYLLDGDKTLMGVTSLMKKHGLSPDYGGIPDEVLQHAAELGTMAHETIEAYCNGESTPDIPLIKSFKKLGLDIAYTEYLVTDYETVASSIDLVNKVDENTVDLIDMKRTATVHKDALAWQLGIYKYLMSLINPDIKVRKCFCLPIKKGNKDDILKDTCGKLIEVEPVSSEQVKALLQAEKDGLIYHQEAESYDVFAVDSFVGERSIMLTQTLSNMAVLDAQIKEMQSLVDAAKDEMYAFMLEHGVDTYEGFGLKVTLKKPYTTSRIDTSALKSKYPDIAAELTKTSESKGNITIKLL